MGKFDLRADNEFGCLPCFCYGHASVCDSARGFSKYAIESTFTRSNDRWRAGLKNGQEVQLQYNPVTKNIGVRAIGVDAIYFLAPDEFLGDQKASYNQYLSFTLRIGETTPQAKWDDVILEGAGKTVTLAIFNQGNKIPSTRAQTYRFRLHEDPNLFGWSPKMRDKDFISILANLTAIKIRATYAREGTGYIDDVKLESARPGVVGSPATWIEMCTCPDGYIGQFCESCAPGFRHDPPGGGAFSECVPCNCNGHTDQCDDESGMLQKTKSLFVALRCVRR